MLHIAYCLGSVLLSLWCQRTMSFSSLLVDDPYETRNLYDRCPGVVDRIQKKIQRLRDSRVQSIAKPRSGPTPENSREVTANTPIGNTWRVVRTDFCTAEIDFPLQPHSTQCDRVEILFSL